MKHSFKRALLACGLVYPFLALAEVRAASPASEFGSCVRELRTQATAKGIDTKTFDMAMTGIEPDTTVLDAMDNQPEFKLPIWDYMAVLVDEQRIADGRRKLDQWARVLADVEQKFGIDRHVVVAVWGIESDYGNVRGGRPLVRSLATVSCFGGRQRFFRGELFATLGILQSGDVPPEQLVGSWAGAFGQTQFMPSTFQRTAVDFDGDGRRDIVNSVPDALASAANYLKRAGWSPGEPWGYEVRLPENYGGPSGRRDRRTLADWSRLGIRRIDRQPVTGKHAAALLLPAGTRGRRSWSSGISMRSIPTMRPNPTRLRSRIWPIGCAAEPHSRWRGRPTTPGSRAPSAASFRSASTRTASMRAARTE